MWLTRLLASWWWCWWYGAFPAELICCPPLWSYYCVHLAFWIGFSMHHVVPCVGNVLVVVRCFPCSADAAHVSWSLSATTELPLYYCTYIVHLLYTRRHRTTQGRPVTLEPLSRRRWWLLSDDVSVISDWKTELGYRLRKVSVGYFRPDSYSNLRDGVTVSEESSSDQ